MIRRTRQSQHSQAGFTLIELIIIIVIIGVLSFVAAPRFNFDGPKVATVARKLVEDLRYAQNRATTTQIRHGIVVTGTQYQISEFDDTGAPTVPAKDPAGAQLVVEMTGSYDGITLSTTLPTQRMYFESTGNPLASPTVKLTAAPNPVTNTIDVRIGTVCEQLSITVATGLIRQGGNC